jgi:hypothetical protein
MNAETMTIQEIIDECEQTHCCGDCQIKEFCQRNFHWMMRPHKWALEDKEA